MGQGISSGSKEIVTTTKAPSNKSLPYSQGVISPPLNNVRIIYTAGQLGIDPSTMKIVSPDAGEQTKQAMENLKAVLEEAGTSLDNILKVTVFLNDMKDFGKVNPVYSSYFPSGAFPARSAFAVRELPLGGVVEIEAVAFTTKMYQFSDSPSTSIATSSNKDNMETKIFLRADGKTQVPVYLAGKVGDPAIIVIQEWWGVTPSIRAHALKLASNGFRVAIPDIYRGKIGVDAEEASHLMQNLDWVGAIEDIRGTAQELKKEGSKKVGIVGFCMGGALSIASGTNLPADLDCAVSFYGIPPKTLADPSINAKIPMEAHFGEKDDLAGFSDPASAQALSNDFLKAGIAHKVWMYPGVGHAFMNDLPEAIEMKKKLKQVDGTNGAGKFNYDFIELFQTK